MSQTPHPFARFIAILGRGRNLTRPLTVEEAEQAMELILAGELLPEQLGAFLMLLRVKEESPEEIAGFVRAVRKTLPARQGADIDFSSYAGKKRQLPWFLLAAFALAQSGRKVFMHGFDGHTPGRLYTGEVLQALGVARAQNLGEASAQLAKHNFAYLDLAAISPPLAKMMRFKPILGLRSPVHTISRMINPFGAPCLLQGIFHPNYMATHSGAAKILGERNMIVFRGEGGEIERRPGKPCETLGLRDGVPFEERWAPLMEEPRQLPDDAMEPTKLLAVWRGDDNAYAQAAITGTMALALKTSGAAPDQDKAQALAAQIWDARDRDIWIKH
ncbi:anthranilate phosphoribosyltransferase [Rhodoblastus acidophilus]|uniref:glycosyl transferase family protein n=1 Tax=Rhodoblastus acidophilus TaxID=1074 RepID=UPI00222439AC|nr:glycosyl transferase family protein [Rhodoblastus acidophilus]MCW2286621.1 anthranilate phosphoribosyltransferase [Rhodoblastus acidophilus]MCW2335467.1 anthranilate phosphoribosyltransferase [Rhodoblastus acidophilus]